MGPSLWVPDDYANVYYISGHNVMFLECFLQLNLMKSMRDAITEDKFPEFVQSFMLKMFPKRNYPQWTVDALHSVNVSLS